MAQLIADRRDMDFVMWEQLDGEELLKFDTYKDFNKKTCDMILTEARKLAINEILPTLQESDEIGVKYENGNVKVPENLHRAHRLILEGEWGNLSVAPEMGGQGAPGLVSTAAADPSGGGAITPEIASQIRLRRPVMIVVRSSRSSPSTSVFSGRC